MFEPEVVEVFVRYGLLVVGGVVAGVINTLAGGGSILLIPILLASGLPPTVANGTLRASILVQAATSAWTFQRKGVYPKGSTLRLLIPIVLGAAAGSFVATRVPDQAMRLVFGVVFVVLGFYLTFGRRKSSDTQAEQQSDLHGGIGTKTMFGALAVGAYGGLIQAGVGFAMIALLVGSAGFSLIEANAIKVRFVAAYSAIALVIFAQAGLVAWREGFAVAVGGLVGGWLGVRLQLKISHTWLQRFVIAAMVVSGVAMILGTVS